MTFTCIKDPLGLVSKYRTPIMGVAILGVMLEHWYGLSKVILPSAFHLMLQLFTSLVFTQGFLFLSGFGLFYSLRKNPSIKDFYKRRFLRLLLPYIIITTPFFIFQTIVEHNSIFVFLGRVSTISYWFEGNFCGMWYIATSCFLYLIFPIIYKLIFNGGKPLSVSIKFLICCALFIGVNEILKVQAYEYWSIHTHYFINSWIFVVGAYFAYVIDIKQIRWGGVLLLMLVFMYLTKDLFSEGREYLGAMLKTVVCIPLLSGFFWLTDQNVITNFINKFFSWFGKYTLELYILHFLFYIFLGYFGEQLCLGSVMQTTTAVILAILVSPLIHKGIEVILKVKL